MTTIADQGYRDFLEEGGEVETKSFLECLCNFMADPEGLTKEDMVRELKRDED